MKIHIYKRGKDPMFHWVIRNGHEGVCASCHYLETAEKAEDDARAAMNKIVDYVTSIDEVHAGPMEVSKRYREDD